MNRFYVCFWVEIIEKFRQQIEPALDQCGNYVPQWWVEFDDELSWLFTNRFSATRYMKVKRMGITEILKRIWLFSANKAKSCESFSKQPTQLIFELNSSLRHIIVTFVISHWHCATCVMSCVADSGLRNWLMIVNLKKLRHYPYTTKAVPSLHKLIY